MCLKKIFIRVRNEGLQPNLRSSPKNSIREARKKEDNLNGKVGRIGMNTKWEDIIYLFSEWGAKQESE